MSVKTLACLYTYVQSTRPGNPSGPTAFKQVNIYKVLLTSATESMITQLSGKAGSLMHALALLALK